MDNNYTIEQIIDMLSFMNETVQQNHPDPEDEVGAIVWNTCLAIAQWLGGDL